MQSFVPSLPLNAAGPFPSTLVSIRFRSIRRVAHQPPVRRLAAGVKALGDPPPPPPPPSPPSGQDQDQNQNPPNQQESETEPGKWSVNWGSGNEQYVPNQWEQHEQRDNKVLEDEKAKVERIRGRERHVHVFLQSMSISIFLTAASRFLDSLRAQLDSPESSSKGAATIGGAEGIKMSEKRRNRVWILQSVEDVTFGMLRGAPYPPRMVIVSDHGGSDQHVTKWVSALDKSGHAFSSMSSHYVDWAECAMFIGGGRTELEMADKWLVASEIINANWMMKTAVSGMREVLAEHAKQVVEKGFAHSFQVFQSIDEPTCFKTVEVYADLEQLSECMKTLDSAYDEKAMPHRAAVNRVRQLYECVGVL